MTPNLLNKICARPVLISWVVGACALDAFVLAQTAQAVPLSAIFAGWWTATLFVLALIPTTLLGFFLGMFTCWPVVRVTCSKYNAARLQVGDQVLILSGPDHGRTAPVYQIYRGQGGWQKVRLDLGPEAKEKYRDIFEFYSLLKIASRGPTS